VHGESDALPAALTEITAGQLTDAGNDVRYTLVPGADHFTLLPTVAANLVNWADELVHGPEAPCRPDASASW
jgi:hypothetical protein